MLNCSVLVFPPVLSEDSPNGNPPRICDPREQAEYNAFVGTDGTSSCSMMCLACCLARHDLVAKDGV